MRAVWLALCCACLAGCSSDQENIQAWMEHEAKDMQPSVKPLPEIKPFPVVDYSAAALVEPFLAARIEPEKKGGGGVRPDMDRRREPLEAFPLESLKMVGLLMQGKVVHALIQADKSLYQVKVGNYMGQDFGVVTSITEAEVTLRELVEDMNGDWVERTSTLQLQERPEGRK
ncbi:pilus assembly protein PilP [Azoarcus olearius]|uniref:Type 4 fimbrial biogenesis protein n=1 Tax=Azoarcus sp. (strain BH72) TaxID=418699 RepID=A1KBQ7_AZOSB|nr:pilus assembly protein PilP [Azoarcus olearius]CAL96263.1 putative type 4 fimbrial biogenesis protein [Azoarcus olearius]